MNLLRSISVSGYKSIRLLADFKLGSLNLLIGANGAGKSNFIGFFRLLSWMMASPGQLQVFVGKSGGANSLLFDGARVTPQISAHLEFETSTGVNEHKFRLFHAAPDTLIFAEEQYRYSANRFADRAAWTSLPPGQRESGLHAKASIGEPTANTLLMLMRQWKVHQFHNTSDFSRLKIKWPVDDGRYLKEDGGNLAPFLLGLRHSRPKEYSLVVSTVRQVLPFFADFVLEPDAGSVLLQWKENASDEVFSAHQASDGMLRFLALTALLLQPEETMPDLLIVDEPELGLHPVAISVLAGMLKAASTATQVIVSTQSVPLLNHFPPEAVVVVDRGNRESTFRRLDPQTLSDWLSDYTLSDLWEMNIIGGRPS